VARSEFVERIVTLPFLLLLVCLLAAPSAAEARGKAIPKGGRRLVARLDSLQVEQRWRPGEAIDWRTGQPDPASIRLRGHCSAFVAAACAELGIYILRPPDHPEYLLANAQCRWLESEGARHGWERIAGGEEAQRRANRGDLVVVCFQNPERDDPGHIAIVRPGRKSLRRFEREGPDVIQAGAVNARQISVRRAFRRHAKVWRDETLHYYAHGLGET
jgi:hypothetical protein